MHRAKEYERRRRCVIWGKDTGFFATNLARLLATDGVKAVDLTGPYDEGRETRYPDPLRLRVTERKIRALIAVLHVIGLRTAMGPTARLATWPLERLVAAVRSVADALTVTWIALRFDAVVFSRQVSVSGRDYEWRVYRRFSCRSILMLHGSEARPPYLNGALFPENRAVDIDELAAETHARSRKLGWVESQVDVIVAAPGVSHFLTRPVVDRDVIGFPIAVDESVTRERASANAQLDERDVPVVLHAPSRALSKGTDRLREIVEELRSEGLEFDLDWGTEWTSHVGLLERLSAADIVLDQMYADLPGGVLAREALALGAVAIVGSPVAGWINDHYASAPVPRSMLVKPDEIKNTLRRLLTDRVARRRQQVLGAENMSTDQAPSAIAARWRQVLFGEIKADWLFDPLSVSAVLHGFAPTVHLRRMTRSLVVARGAAALRLAHNPRLEAAVLRFANQWAG